MQIQISGYSDDLVEIDGDISEEYQINFKTNSTQLILLDTITQLGVLIQCKFDGNWEFEYKGNEGFVIENMYDEDSQDHYLEIETTNPIVIGQVL